MIGNRPIKNYSKQLTQQNLQFVLVEKAKNIKLTHKNIKTYLKQDSEKIQKLQDVGKQMVVVNILRLVYLVL